VTIVFAVAAATVAVDALTKQLVTNLLAEGRLYALAAGWGLRRVHNQRGAVGAPSVTHAALLWLVVLGAVIAGLRLLPGEPQTLALIGLGMAIGGAAGNVADRIRHGAVVDFVAAGPWPVFNLADAAMAVGLAMAAVSVL
jgi:signal peptidase II